MVLHFIVHEIMNEKVKLGAKFGTELTGISNKFATNKKNKPKRVELVGSIWYLIIVYIIL